MVEGEFLALTGTDENLCQIFMRLYADNLVSKFISAEQRPLYLYHDERWTMACNKCYLLKNNMRKQLQKYVGDRVQGVRQKLLITTDDNEAEKYKEVLKAYLKAQGDE